MPAGVHLFGFSRKAKIFSAATYIIGVTVSLPCSVSNQGSY